MNDSQRYLELLIIRSQPKVVLTFLMRCCRIKVICMHGKHGPFWFKILQKTEAGQHISRVKMREVQIILISVQDDQGVIVLAKVNINLIL